MVRTIAIALLLSSAPGLGAEVSIETWQGPPPELAGLRLPPAPAGARTLFDSGVGLISKGNKPDEGTWFIPLFKVDTRGSNLATSTFFSIRNEGDTAINVVAEYFDTSFSVPRQNLTRHRLIPDQIAAVNVRDVPDLAVDRDGFARGLIRITPPPGEPVSVDTFQLDAANNFATGQFAFTLSDFCDFWQVRFLDFGGASGSVMTVFVNGPRGSGAGNPATIVGTVFNQQGQPLNNFNVRTSQWAMEIPLLGLVEDDDARFGSIELVLNATGNPGGVVSVVHSAFGRFSVGAEGVCKD